MQNRQCLSICFLALFSGLFLSSCVSKLNTPALSNNSHSVDTSEQKTNEIIAKGDEALARRAYDDAQVQYALAVKNQPNNIDVLYKLAVVHYEKESYDVARDLLQVILDKNAEHVGAYEMLGIIALKNEDTDTAENRLSQALHRNESRWRSHNAMGVVKDMQSKHTEAQHHFELALLNNPNKAQTQNNLGYSYYLSGSYQQAETHFLKATQINANYEKAWANLGLLYVRMKQYENARYAFSKVVDDHAVANNLGYLSMLQGDDAMARQELSRALLLAPTHYPRASENLASLNTKARTQVTSAGKKLQGNDLAVEAVVVGEIVEEKKLQQESQVVIKESAFSSENTSTHPVSVPKSAKKPQAPERLDSSLSEQYLALLGYPISNEFQSLKHTLMSFQTAHQLEPTGVLGKASLDLLETEAIKQVKSLLVSLNFEADPNNGNLDAITVASLKMLQRKNALPVNGKLNKKTLSLLTRYMHGDAIASNYP